MAVNYQGRDIQQQSSVGLRLEDITSYDYSAYDSGSGQGAIEIVNRWLVADTVIYSSSVEFDKDYGGYYSASYFQPTVINISGNLYGTATSASYALTASYAMNGGGGSGSSPAFPFVGTAVITGSLIVSGSTGILNTSTARWTADGILYDINSVPSVLWGNGNRNLRNSSNVEVLNWSNGYLNDNSGNASVDWANRTLYTPGGLAGMEYSTEYIASSEVYPVHTTSTTTANNLIDNSFNSGHIIRATVDAGVADYDLVCLNASGTWFSLKNTSPEATKMVGVCISQASGTVLIEGDVIVSNNATRGVYVMGAGYGLPIYVSDTTGRMTTTIPISGVVRVLGHIYYRSTTNTNWWLMKFRPSTDWYVI